MNAKVENQIEAEIALCDAISGLIRRHDYSVYDVRSAVASFTGQLLDASQKSHPQTAARLALPRLSLPAGSGELETRWASHSHGYVVSP